MCAAQKSTECTAESSQATNSGLSYARWLKSAEADAIVRNIDRFDEVGVYLGAVSIIIMFLVVFFEVVLRSSLKFSFLVADELSAYLLASSSFFALGYTLRTRGHVRVTLLFDRYSPRMRKWIEAIILLVQLPLVGSLLVWITWDFVIPNYVSGIRHQSQLQTPLWIPQSTLILGLFTFVLALLARLSRVLRGEGD